MSVASRFLLYNLLPALVVGTIAWLAIVAGIRLLRIRHGPLRLCLLWAPLLKSTLVLLGIGLVLPWPRDVFGAWQDGAVPWHRVVPVFLIAVGAALLLRGWRSPRARAAALEGAVPAEQGQPRLTRSLERVVDGFRRRQARLTGVCRCPPSEMRARLLVTDRPLASPLAVSEGEPTIVVPRRLVPLLDDEELDGALAHEMAHLYLRRPSLCASDNLRAFVAVNPMASLMSGYLRREEEKACDDMALLAGSQADVYARMLLKSYRFAVSGRGAVRETLAHASHLLGLRPMLSERIERLLAPPEETPDLGVQVAATVLMWALIVAVFFSA